MLLNRVAVGLCVVLALITVACRGAARSGVAPAPGSAGANAMQSLTFSYVDDSRHRTIKTDVFLPADVPTALPVVLFSHGLLALPTDYRALLTTWTKAGFAVVAPEYPMTSRGVATVQPFDLSNQPDDAIFALDRTLRQADLKSKLDGTRVVVAGHSEGALTTYGLTTTCCRDPRVQGAIVMAGDAVGFERYTFSSPPMPVLFIHGDEDPLVPIAMGRAAFAKVPWPKAFLTLQGGAHVPPYIDTNGVVATASTDFLRWVLDKDAAALAALRHDGNSDSASLDDKL